MGFYRVPVNEYRIFYDEASKKFAGTDTPPKGDKFWLDNRERALKLFGANTDRPDYLFKVLYRIKSIDTEISINTAILVNVLKFLGLKMPDVFKNRRLTPRLEADFLWKEFEQRYINIETDLEEEMEAPYKKELRFCLIRYLDYLQKTEMENLFELVMSPNFRYRTLIEENIDYYRKILDWGDKVEGAGILEYKLFRPDLAECVVAYSHYRHTKIEEKVAKKVVGKNSENVILETFAKELCYRLNNFIFIRINNYWFIEDIQPFSKLHTIAYT